MNFDIDTCKWVLWGAKNPYNTWGHIQAAFLRALKHLGKEVYWLDNGDDLSGIDFSNTLFHSMNCVYRGMPQNKDAFYLIHNMAFPSVLGANDVCVPYFEGLKALGYGVHIGTAKYSSSVMELGPNIFFEPSTPSLHMTWGTDLLPYEIEANKPTRTLNSDSRVFNFVGTMDGTKKQAIQEFGRAAAENGISYGIYGGFGLPTVSDEEHIRLIKSSYMAPAFEEKGQNDTGYISCRLFKNISYGHFGITQSRFAQDLFGGKLIYGTDAYQLFYDARERLQNMPLKELHDLMDEVAKKHTYLNKIYAIVKAVKMVTQ